MGKEIKHLRYILKVLNRIIKKGTGKSDYPNYFIKNNQPTITKTKEIAN